MPVVFALRLRRSRRLEIADATRIHQLAVVVVAALRSQKPVVFFTRRPEIADASRIRPLAVVAVAALRSQIPVLFPFALVAVDALDRRCQSYSPFAFVTVAALRSQMPVVFTLSPTSHSPP